MKKLVTVTALTFAIAAPAAAQIDPAEVEEYLALSNSSAAERIVDEGSMGPERMIELKFALGEMSAAERKVFFESDDVTRAELMEAKLKLRDGDSAAETDAIGTATN